MKNRQLIALLQKGDLDADVSITYYNSYKDNEQTIYPKSVRIGNGWSFVEIVASEADYEVTNDAS
jgi:hypothetical protein